MAIPTTTGHPKPKRRSRTRSVSIPVLFTPPRFYFYNRLHQITEMPKAKAGLTNSLVLSAAKWKVLPMEEGRGKALGGHKEVKRRGIFGPLRIGRSGADSFSS